MICHHLHEELSKHKIVQKISQNIQIIQGGQDLTAQVGLIPVVKFLKKHGFASKIEQALDHQRGATGVYDAVWT